MKRLNLREMILGAYGGRFAGDVADNLDKIKLPAPRIKGAKIDAGEIAESLRANRAELDKHLKDVQRELSEALLLGEA